MKASEMKLSASTACLGKTVPEAVPLYAEAGIDAMEIAGMNVKCLDEYKLEEIKAECDRYGVELRSVHLPFSREHSIAHPDKQLRDRTVRVNKQVMDRVAALGVKFCVIHPSSEPNEDQMRPQLLEYCAENLFTLCEYARSLGMELAMENLPRSCLCNTSEEVIAMLARIPGLKTCFDLNHFLPWKGAVPDNVAHIYRLKEQVGDRLISLHVSDYHFEDEEHLFPLDGTNDWRGILRALEETDYPGYFNYELNSKHTVAVGKTLHDVRRNFEQLLKLL